MAVGEKLRELYGRVPKEWRAATIAASVVAGLIAAGIIAVVAPGHDSDPFVGGCEAFNIYAQNQFTPVGTLVWDAPSPTAPNHPAFAPNQLITVDGWVKTRSAYITNGPPWDSNVWYHLANEAGWVSFAGVRAVQTTPDPQGGFGPGSDAAPVDPDCSGTYRP